MRRALLAVTLMLLATPTFAACPSLPDDQASNYVENRTALALCQQRELGSSTDAAAQQAKIDAILGNMQIELRRQQMLQQQMIANWPDL